MNSHFTAFQAREHISDMLRAAAKERLARSAARGDGRLSRLARRLGADVASLIQTVRATRPTLIRREDAAQH